MLKMFKEGREITCVSIPVCDTDSLSATLCAREDGARAVFGDARQARRESTRQMHRGLVQGLGLRVLGTGAQQGGGELMRDL